MDNRRPSDYWEQHKRFSLEAFNKLEAWELNEITMNPRGELAINFNKRIEARIEDYYNLNEQWREIAPLLD